jgi:hypothetical protein
VVIRFDETNWWLERAGVERDMELYWPGTGDYQSSHIDMFSTGRVVSDSTLFPQFQTAVTLLEGFRTGQLATSDVFDIDKLAKYLALCDLFGSPHSLSINQIRLYYDPITSRLEPIPFDVDGGITLHRISSAWSKDMNTAWHGGRKLMFLQALFKDVVFFDRYVAELERYSQTAYLDTLLAEITDELARNIAIIHRTYPSYKFSPRVLYENQVHIRRYLTPVKGLHAYLAGTRVDGIDLELGNIQHIPVEVMNVSYKDSLVLRPRGRTVLLGKDGSDPVEHKTVTFDCPKGFQWLDTMIPDLKVNYKLVGTDRLRHETVFPWLPIDESILASDLMRRPANAQIFEFLRIDETTRQIDIKPGQWNVDDDLIIPGGYQVNAAEGVKLNLTNSATILSYSPLRFVGTEETPIVVSSDDGTGQGLTILNAHEPSYLECVRFEGLTSPFRPEWKLTGAVTFRESPVTMVSCHFTENRSEDALNIISSKFSIHSTVFSETSSDAIDADFAKGEIRQTAFVNCGNDGLDVSGSVVELEDIFMNGVGDKGISVGENSRMVADRVHIESAAIAIAAKDMSEVILKDVKISGAGVGIAAFQKKPEFGGAIVSVTNLQMDHVEMPYLSEADSRLTLDGQLVASNHEDVESILYGVVYGKSSR